MPFRRPSFSLLPSLAPCAVAFAILCPAALRAQDRDNAGFGGTYRRAALDAATGSSLNLGIAVDLRDGHLFVSATGAGGQPPHRIHEFDATGAHLGSFAQPAVQNTTALGIRDLAFDGQSLLGGSEVGISVFSTTGAPVGTVQAANGPQTIVQPIGGPALAQLGTLRAVAFDASGNGGNGSLFVADFASPILEIDLGGAVLRTIPNAGWSAYGLAIDPITGNLWVHADQNGDIAEIDRASGLPTGRAFAPAVPGAPGGLAEASTVAGHHESWPSRFLLASVVQAAPEDVLLVQRVHLHAGRLGWEEPRLSLGVDAAPLQGGSVPFSTGSIIRLRIDSPGTAGIGPFGWPVVNFYNEAATDGVTGLFPELRARTLLSVPTGVASQVLTLALGSTLSIQLPPTFVVGNGDLLRLQAFYVDPALPTGFGVTNQAFFVGAATERGIVVEAAGANSFQNDPARPFWRVRSDATHGHGAILQVELSFAGAALPAGQLRFDVDQLSMNDRFDGGNSTVPGCAGTYRNGSDVTCGLDYAAPGVHVDPACHTQPGQSSGFRAVWVPGTTLDAETLTFAFTAFAPGRAFEFDCDTDGGLPSGDAHAGTIVRVTTANSGVLTGILQADPARPDRAVLFFP